MKESSPALVDSESDLPEGWTKARIAELEVAVEELNAVLGMVENGGKA